MYICNHIQRIKMHSQQYFGSDCILCILRPCRHVKSRKRQPQLGQYSSRAMSLPHVGNGTSNKLVGPAMDECRCSTHMCVLWCYNGARQSSLTKHQGSQQSTASSQKGSPRCVSAPQRGSQNLPQHRLVQMVRERRLFQLPAAYFRQHRVVPVRLLTIVFLTL